MTLGRYIVSPKAPPFYYITSQMSPWSHTSDFSSLCTVLNPQEMCMQYYIDRGVCCFPKLMPFPQLWLGNQLRVVILVPYALLDLPLVNNETMKCKERVLVLILVCLIKIHQQDHMITRRTGMTGPSNPSQSRCLFNILAPENQPRLVHEFWTQHIQYSPQRQVRHLPPEYQNGIRNAIHYITHLNTQQKPELYY